MIALQAILAAMIACIFVALVGFAYTRAKKGDQAEWGGE